MTVLYDRTLFISDYHNESDLFTTAVGLLYKVQRAVNTPYVVDEPVQCVSDLVNWVTTTNLSRRFVEGYPSIFLYVSIDQDVLVVSQTTTSDTDIRLVGYFDNDMAVHKWEFTVELPEHRFHPDGNHYNSLTKTLYGSDIPADFPTPSWLVRNNKMCHFKDNPSLLDEMLSLHGFTPDKFQGLFKRLWSDNRGNMVVERDCYRSENPWQLVKFGTTVSNQQHSWLDSVDLEEAISKLNKPTCLLPQTVGDYSDWDECYDDGDVIEYDDAS